MDQNYNDISSALLTYLDGLYEGDTEKLGSVFHPVCHLFSIPVASFSIGHVISGSTS